MSLTKSHAIIAASIFIAFPATGSELIYQPQSSSFGGNPLNYNNLMSHANAINHYNSGSGYNGYTAPSDLEQLTRSVESSLAYDIFRDPSAYANAGGPIETSQFEIILTQDQDISGRFEIQVTSKETGETTVFTVFDTTDN